MKISHRELIKENQLAKKSKFVLCVRGYSTQRNFKLKANTYHENRRDQIQYKSNNIH